MIFRLLILIAAVSAQTLPMPAVAGEAPLSESSRSRQLAQLFVDGCLLNRFEVPADAITMKDSSFPGRIDAGERALIAVEFNKPFRGRFFRTSIREGKDSDWTGGCSLTSATMSLNATWNVVAFALTGCSSIPFPNNRVGIAIDNPAAGYRITLRKRELRMSKYREDAAARAISQNHTLSIVVKTQDMSVNFAGDPFKTPVGSITPEVEPLQLCKVQTKEGLQ